MTDLGSAKTAFALRRGDDALVLSQRLSEWCGHGPELELDMALTNLALDLVGQARLWLSLAGDLEGRGRDEDALAMRRDAIDFTNALLVEQENGDWGRTIVRQFLFAAYQQPLLEALTASAERRFADIADKGLKENAYALRFCAEWVERLGDGTEESHARAQAALDDLWPFTAELFVNDAQDIALIGVGVGVDLEALRAPWLESVDAVLAKATLTRPVDGRPVLGGRAGRHTEHLGHLIAEMQFLQRAYPDARW